MPPLDNIRDAAGDTDGTASATTVDVLPFILFSFVLSAANNAGRALVASEKKVSLSTVLYVVLPGPWQLEFPRLGTGNSCLPTPPFPWRDRCTAGVPGELMGLSFIKIFGVAELNLLIIQRVCLYREDLSGIATPRAFSALGREN